MLPKVAIIGRPNVGKSSLMNMLAQKRISIVEATPGVTRDRISFDLELPPNPRSGRPRFCELIDTGGYGIYSSDDNLSVFTRDVEQQIQFAVKEADLILFVIDALTGLTPLDEQVGQLLRKNAADLGRVILVANKTDDESHIPTAMEAAAMGFGEPLCVSTTSKFGKNRLIETLCDSLDFSDFAPTPPESEMLLAIVGKRNAGKSTLVNTLAGAERVIASEVAGTTRDSIDVRFEIEGHHLTAIDTAGVRKRKSLEDDIEYYSLHRALRSIRRADVVILMVDATTDISSVDKKLSHEIIEHDKPCIIAVSKWDLVEGKLIPDDYTEYLTRQLRGLDFAPLAFISSHDNRGVTDVIRTARDLYEQANTRVGTGQLNRIVKEILQKRGPSSHLGKRARVFYVTMPRVAPPTITMFVNNPDLFNDQYKRYMINSFRELLPFAEVPIKLEVRARRREDRGATPIAEA
ncbi:MAG: ribosome biogenesis GTPase Der [Planctomycetota bacterium]|jgi:GTP-binding protein